MSTGRDRPREGSVSLPGHGLHYRPERLDALISPANLAHADKRDGEVVRRSLTSGLAFLEVAFRLHFGAFSTP
jgi:hypothetical protein